MFVQSENMTSLLQKHKRAECGSGAFSRAGQLLRGREEETKSWAVAGCGGGGGMMKEEDEEEKEGERCVVLHCALAAPAALPLCCLAHPASGRRPITAQESSATSVQCVRTNRGGRRYRDVRKTRGGRRGGKQIGERGTRGGEDGNGRRQEEKRRERQTALHPHLRMEQQQPAPFPRSCAWRQSIPAAASACREKTKENTCMLMSHSHLSTWQQQEGKPISHFLLSLPLSPVISPSDAHK